MPLRPVSPYGASKLGCEAMIGAYCHMFEHAARWRCASPTSSGPNQTHGVAYDFIRRLRADPTALDIMGDGTQSKSYVHVDDVVEALVGLFPAEGTAMRGRQRRPPRTTSPCARSPTWWSSGSASTDVEYRFGEGSRGWKGDVPVVRFDSTPGAGPRVDATGAPRARRWPRRSTR